MIIFRGRDIRFCLDRPAGQLWRGEERSGEPIHLPPKQWELLRYLAENPKRLVSKEELVAKIWGVGRVTDDAISRAVMGVRRALGDDDPDHPLFIQTAHGRGFRFVAEIESTVEQTSHNGDQVPAEALGGDSTAQPVEEQPGIPDTSAPWQENDALELKFEYRDSSNYARHSGTYTLSWNHLFAVMGPYMFGPSNMWAAEAQLRAEIIGWLNKGDDIEGYRFDLLEETRNYIKVQFMSLGLIEPGPEHQTMKLTPWGVKMLIAASRNDRRKVD